MTQTQFFCALLFLSSLVLNSIPAFINSTNKLGCFRWEIFFSLVGHLRAEQEHIGVEQFVKSSYDWQILD